MAKVCSGYPRFVRHPFIEEFAAVYFRRSGKDAVRYQPFFFSSETAQQDALKRLAELAVEVESLIFEGIAVIVAVKASEAERQLAKYIQHTGTGLSSREAEDLMVRLTPGRKPFPENRVLPVGDTSLSDRLHRWFSPAATSKIWPCKSGMNAFYAAFQAVNHVQTARGRRDWISIGWLYLDTMHILDIYLPEGGKTTAFTGVGETDRIVEFIRQNGNRVAGLVLEAPTNPLVQTPDIQRISKACVQAGILTVMDPSLVSPQNVDLSPLCDIVCCSLTKYSVFEGDVMIGAVSVNLDRPEGETLATWISDYLTPAYSRDLSRLGASLHEAAEVLDVINANTMRLASFLEKHPGISRLHWAYAPSCAAEYAKIHRGPNRPGGVLTLELVKPVAQVYDALPLPKGPSFGTGFTLVCPYIHLAHYDLLKTESGLKRMKQAGIHGQMIRLSVGTENVNDLMEVFDRSL